MLSYKNLTHLFAYGFLHLLAPNMSASHLTACVCVLSSTDQVLEKAMHKCVLKPLKSVIEVALHDFQVRDEQNLFIF